MIEMKPCPNPWCVPSGTFKPTLHWYGPHEACVECGSCGMQGPSFSPVVLDDDGEQVGTQDAESLAVSAWNTRQDISDVLIEALTQAASDVLVERQRQIDAEGWTPEHDDEHADTQLAGAAVCYALATVKHWAAGPAIQQFWPWDDAWWKPAEPRRNLVRAGALILAEIERLDRDALRQAKGGEG